MVTCTDVRMSNVNFSGSYLATEACMYPMSCYCVDIMCSGAADLRLITQDRSVSQYDCDAAY